MSLRSRLCESDLHIREDNKNQPGKVVMALSKELTNHSLPEIGDVFGGRDHTTVLHACCKISTYRTLSKMVVKQWNYEVYE